MPDGTYVDAPIRLALTFKDLTVEQQAEFQFVVNLKTAKTLGVQIPQSVMARATRVIE